MEICKRKDVELWKTFFKKKKEFFMLKLSKIRNKNSAKEKNTKNHLKNQKKLKKSEFFLIFVKKNNNLNRFFYFKNIFS